MLIIHLCIRIFQLFFILNARYCVIKKERPINNCHIYLYIYTHARNIYLYMYVIYFIFLSAVGYSKTGRVFRWWRLFCLARTEVSRRVEVKTATISRDTHNNFHCVELGKNQITVLGVIERRINEEPGLEWLPRQSLHWPNFSERKNIPPPREGKYRPTWGLV